MRLTRISRPFDEQSSRRGPFMTAARFTLLICTALASAPGLADETASTEEQSQDQIVVTGYAGTKTDTALAELPQPIKVITAEQYEAQGAINISDTVQYAAGVLANPYGRDTRVDGLNVRGPDALQFRDGMRDIFSDRKSKRLNSSH